MVRDAEFEPAGFFVLRTPLLPFSQFASWPSNQHDQSWLHELIEDPVVREALFVASPHVAQLAETPLRAGEPRVKNTLVKYAIRMSSRCTPFGFFATVSAGVLGDTSSLLIGARNSIRRFARLDMDYLIRIARSIQARLPTDVLLFKVNPDLYMVGDRIRYTETRSTESERSYHLVEIGAQDHVVDTLKFVDGSRSVPDIVGFLCQRYAVDSEEALAFVDDLNRNQILVSDLQVPLTVIDPLGFLCSYLEERTPSSPDLTLLVGVRARLSEINAQPPGITAERYNNVVRELSNISPAYAGRIFQVDTFRPCEGLSLGTKVIEEILRGVQVLERIGRPAIPDEALERFARDFTSRYEDQSLPLLEVLDEEYGLGFGRSVGIDRLEAPLLDGVRFLAADAADDREPGGARPALARILGEASSRHALEIELSDRDIDDLAVRGGRNELPDAIAVMASLSSPPQKDVAESSFRVHLRDITGPSGANLMGRFCHMSEQLLMWVREHIRREEALDADAVFAEIVHLPQDRTGNVLLRPMLREYEIVYLGTSGAPSSSQIATSDLLVTVRDGQVILTSRRLKRRIVPRITTAHYYGGPRNLAVYQFLAACQTQGMTTGLRWRWHPFDAFPFLPQVRFGRVVLSRARWRLTEEEIVALRRASQGERRKATETLARDRGLPRFVNLVSVDAELTLDLENPSCIDVLVDELRGSKSATFVEGDQPSELCVAGPDGRYSNELIIPFTRKRATSSARIEHRPSGFSYTSGAVVRSYLPGSEWLYLKLYVSPAVADRVLTRLVGPLASGLIQNGAADKWFFLRYADPDWHLRVRIHCGVQRADQTLSTFTGGAYELVQSGVVRRLETATYEPETNRYGGPIALDVCERIFCADSTAVASILEVSSDATVRWQVALRGIDSILDSAGYDLHSKRGFAQERREALGLNLKISATTRKDLAVRFRAERYHAEDAIAGRLHGEVDSILEKRLTSLRPLMQELRRLAGGRLLTQNLEVILMSLAHTWVNRVMRSSHRRHEFVLYDFLERVYMSSAARASGRQSRSLK